MLRPSIGRRACAGSHARSAPKAAINRDGADGVTGVGVFAGYWLDGLDIAGHLTAVASFNQFKADFLVVGQTGHA